MADKADVEHQLVPRILLVLYADGVAHHFEALDIGGHDAVMELRLGNDVGGDMVEGLLGDDGRLLVLGRLTPNSRALDGVELGVKDGPQRALLAAALLLLPMLPTSASFRTRHY